MYKMNVYTDYMYFVLGGMKDEMKKLTGMVLAVACMASFVGCGSSEKKEISVEKPEDLKTLTIGVQQGTTGDIIGSEQVEKRFSDETLSKGIHSSAGTEKWKD